MIVPKQLSKVLAGHSTQIVIQPYADRILVLVTQSGKVGSLIQATIPDTVQISHSEPPTPDGAPSDDSTLPSPCPAIELTTLFGSAPSDEMKTLYSIYASQIATMVWTAEGHGSTEGSRRSIIVGLSLRKYSDDEDNRQNRQAVFRGVMSALQNALTQQ